MLALTRGFDSCGLPLLLPAPLLEMLAPGVAHSVAVLRVPLEPGHE